MKENWNKFLEGHWTKEMPQKEGMFFRADYKGNQANQGVVYLDPNTNKYKAHPAWGAWWWSEPTPDLPDAGPLNG